MERLAGIKKFVDYSRGNLVSQDANVPVDLIFRSDNLFGPNLDLGNRQMQLGWNSVGIFEATANGLKLCELYKQGKTDVSISAGASFTQVATRAVHSCTFAHIYGGSFHILAHLDLSYLDWGYDKISGFIDAQKLRAAGLCSRLHGREEIAFSDKLKKICVDGYNEFYRHTGDEENFPGFNGTEAEVNRRLQSFYMTDKHSHLEIGISCERDGVRLFGDFTDLNGYDETSSAPTKLFSDEDELLKIKISNQGGCCVVA